MVWYVWKYNSSPVPMTPILRVEEKARKKAETVAAVMKLMRSPVLSKTLKGKRKSKGRYSTGIEKVLL